MGVTEETTSGEAGNGGTSTSPGLGKDILSMNGKVLLTDELLGVVIGCVAALLLIVAIVIYIIIYRRRQKIKKSWDFDWGDNDKAYICRSEPSSRTSSPKLAKRKSCSDASGIRGVMVRSMTTDNIPDFTLPPERVQPCDSYQRAQSSSSFQYQQGVIGNLQPDLYRSITGYDDDVFYLPPSDRGRLWFSIVYDGAIEQLQVTLLKVRELIGRGRENAARDPFVKIFLLPDERNCRVSKVRKKTLSPVYNEAFIFQVPEDGIKERILRFSVYDVDKRRIRHSLGHVLVPLSELDLTKSDPIWKDLEISSQVSATLGEICFSLNYLPNLDKVKLIVLNGRNLRQMNTDKHNSVHVKIQMMHGRKVYKTKKTISQRSSSDPVFNESFAFSVSGKLLDSFSFEISVVTSSGTPIRHDEIYGKVVVGSFMYARGDELLHWQEMLSQPKNAVQKWHVLSPM